MFNDRDPLDPPEAAPTSVRPCSRRLLTDSRLQWACRHRHRLGPRPVAHCFAELLGRIGAEPAMLDTVLDWQRLDPDVIAALGGGDFPPVRLCEVPR
jgi:hypothetical protein